MSRKLLGGSEERMPEPTRPDPDRGHAPGADERSGRAGGTPRWVKVLGIVALALVVLVVILVLVGGHGPERHTGAIAPPAGMTEGHPAAAGGHG
jgi:hypothetical protein